MSPKTARFAALASLTLALLAVLACDTTVPPERRTFADPEGKWSYVVPPGWVVWVGEARSPKGSLFSVETVTLEDSMPAFVNGLPDTMVVLTKEQTQRFFTVVGNGVEKDITIGGVKARQVTFPVQVREADPVSEVTFWIVRHGNTVFVLRISYPAGLVDQDSPAVQDLLASWKFTPLPTPDPDTTTGKFVRSMPQQ